MAVEIVGFNQVYECAKNMESIKRHAKQFTKKKIEKLIADLIADGMDAKIAKITAESMAEAGLI